MIVDAGSKEPTDVDDNGYWNVPSSAAVADTDISENES